MDSSVQCSRHAGAPAAARCVECGSMLCRECRARVDGRSYCRPCVPASLKSRLPGRRSPAFAAALSAAPGLGQMYAGAMKRGLCFGGLAMLVGANLDEIPSPIPIFLWVFNLFDAWALAQDRNVRIGGGELSPADKRTRRFWGLFGSVVALFAVLQATALPALNADLLWPVALGLYGLHLVFDRKPADVQHA